MKVLLCSIIIFIILMVFSGCHRGMLLKVNKGEYDEPGVETGYVNLKGDTVIPMDRYAYCYTDTLETFAVVMKHSGECVAIDRKGEELFGVYWYDNGPDPLSDGLFRIIKNDRIGYADDEGRIVIEAQYKCATPFENGRAKVAYRCTKTPDGEYTVMESSKWFYIDKNGKRVEE